MNRRTKGGTIRYFNEVVTKNSDFLWEYLLDGELAQQKLIIPEVIEPMLMGHETIPNDYYFPFMSCISVEAWLRSCGKIRARAAA